VTFGIAEGHHERPREGSRMSGVKVIPSAARGPRSSVGNVIMSAAPKDLD
jgi:hypothetical protein